jgi:hypothetical protein
MKRSPTTLPFPPLGPTQLDAWTIRWSDLVRMVENGRGLRVQVLNDDRGGFGDILCRVESFTCPSFSDDAPERPALRVVG